MFLCLNYLNTLYFIIQPHENQEGDLNVNTGITFPNDEPLVSDEESTKDKNECTVEQFKPIGTSKKSKARNVTFTARKRKEVNNAKNKADKIKKTTKSRLIEDNEVNQKERQHSGSNKKRKQRKIQNATKTNLIEDEVRISNFSFLTT